jgi:branched-chain amino acid transport system ATP-binding protein
VSLLEVSAVTKDFAGIRALHDVGLTVEAGERVGLIGPNGAGKTTLFDCILGATPVDRGQVRFDGRDLARMAVHRRARLGMGRTFQRVGLFTTMTVREHLLVAHRISRGTWSLRRDLLGRGAPTRDEVAYGDELLARLGIGDLADEPVEALTLGQARLVEVGRALATEPKLLLLDEPSSGLDHHETAALAVTLRTVQAAADVAILLIEHDVELVAGFTERCCVLDFGRCIALGQTGTVLADPAVRTAYLGETAGGPSAAGGPS